MSGILFWIAIISLLGLVLIAVFRFIRNKELRRFIISLVILTLCGFIIFKFLFPTVSLTARSSSNEIYFIIVLYICMLGGMFAQYLYSLLSKRRNEREKFDFGLFVAPIFASPIVFIPLYAALQNSQIDVTDLSDIKVMVFFVAFQNGFFWKEFFDGQRNIISRKNKNED